MERSGYYGIKILSVALVFAGLFSSSIVCAQESAPNFTLTDVDGRFFSLSDFGGSAVVLSFISTRVVFCKVQTYVFVNVSKFLGDDVVFILIGVSNDTVSVGGDTEQELREFRDECGFEGFVAKDTKGVARDYDVNYVPLTFIIDKEGYARGKYFGTAALKEQVLIGELQMIIPEFSCSFLLVTLTAFAGLVIALSKRKHFKNNGLA